MIFSVTASIFYKKVSEFTTVKRFTSTYHDFYIVNTQIWQEGDEIRPGHMYLVESETLQRHYRQFRGCFLVVAGAYPETGYHVSSDNDMFFCPDVSGLGELCNIIFTILQQFRSWRNAMNNILLSTESFYEIFATSKELLNMSFLLFNQNYEILAVSDDFFQVNKEYARPEEFILAIQEDEDGIYTDNYQNRHLYSLASSQSTQIYCYNIFYHDEHTATLIAAVPAKDDYTGDLQFIYYIGAALTDYYASYYSRINHTEEQTMLVKLISLLHQGQLPDENLTVQTLSNYGWLTYHKYQAIEFSFIKRKEIGFSSDYFCAQIEKLFPHSIAYPEEESVFCVRNLSLESDDSFYSQLPYFLRDNLCHAGLSGACDGFFNLRSYFAQAHTALQIGPLKAPTFWYYRFSDFAFDYLLMQCRKEYAPVQTQHQALGILLEHDKKRGTEYYRTLRVYLENDQNASQSAKDLYIHRSTFLQRLAQIIKLTRIDLDDFQERTYLQLSYLL